MVAAAHAVNGILAATVASVEAYSRMRAELSALVARIAEGSGTISAASHDIAATSGGDEPRYTAPSRE